MIESLTHQHALAVGSMLMEYRIDRILGAGGFGITYLAFDTHLEKRVALKEYLPAVIAARAPSGSVVPLSASQQNDYQWGMERFLHEARTLARFSHPNIVRVNRFFQAHGTACMVMDYEDGESLKQMLGRERTLPEPWLKAMLGPLLEGLERIHAGGFLHRDIKPDNLFIRTDGSPVLIDFGAARQAIGNASQHLTAIVSPGFAPFEQYSAGSPQGPWSDLYALAGVLFQAVTGSRPPDAVSRIKGDTLRTALAPARQNYSTDFIQAIEWGMEVDEKQRPQSVADWRPRLLGGSRAESAPATSGPAGGPKGAAAGQTARAAGDSGPAAGEPGLIGEPGFVRDPGSAAAPRPESPNAADSPGSSGSGRPAAAAVQAPRKAAGDSLLTTIIQPAPRGAAGRSGRESVRRGHTWRGVYVWFALAGVAALALGAGLALHRRHIAEEVAEGIRPPPDPAGRGRPAAADTPVTVVSPLAPTPVPAAPTGIPPSPPPPPSRQPALPVEDGSRAAAQLAGL